MCEAMDMLKKWYIKGIGILLILLFSFLLGKLFYYYQQQRTIDLVNRELQFSGLKLMMDLEEIQNTSNDYDIYSVIDGYIVDFENIDLRAHIFSLVNEKSRYHNKVVYINTWNTEHQLFGYSMYTPIETKMKVLKKHGFKYKDERMEYLTKYGINIRVDSQSHIILWIDNPDNYMGSW
jgi:hypothetical protein